MERGSGLEFDVCAVVPTFRRPVLAEALRSALGQEGVSVQAIVVDDSPDGSARSIVEALRDPRISYLQRETPSGGRPALVRNEGWPHAAAPFIHFLDDDDRVVPGAYRALVAALRANPDRGVAFGRVAPFGDDPAALARERAYFADAAKRARRAAPLGRLWLAANLLARPTVLVCSAGMVRRECVEAIGGFDPAVEICEDVEFYLRAIRRFGAVWVDEPVVGYRTSAGSIMQSEKRAEPFRRAYARMHERYREAHGALELGTLRLLARTVLRFW